MRPSFPVEMFESTSSGASDPTELPFLKVNDCVLSPAKHNSMSLNGGTSWIEQQRKSTVQRKRLAMMPRSISIADMQAGSKHSVEQFAPSFRSSPPSIDYLGNHAHVQSGSQPLSERSQSQLLLPNDYQHQQASLTPNSSFTSDEKKLRRRIHYKSYQDLHILSMYQEKPSMKRSDSTGSSASTTFEPDDESSNGSLYSEGSEELSPLPVTPIDDVPLAEDASPEVKLLLNDDLKKQRSNARQVHVIEHHQDKTCLKQADQHDILPMKTTVLTVPGKPRLIQIHRPQPSHHSMRTTLTEATPPSKPTTPTHTRSEVSTFSPYDTPASGTPFSDISRTASEATPMPRNQPRLTVNTDLTMFQQMPQTPPGSETLDSSRYSTSRKPSRRLADPFGSPRPQDERIFLDSSSFVQESPPELIRSSTYSISDTSTTSHVYRQQGHMAQLTTAISLTSRAFDAMASKGLYLDSPELSMIRSTFFECSLNDMLLPNLGKIFPRASNSPISTLAAWLLIDRYFSRLFMSAPLRTPASVDDRIPPAYGSHLTASPHQSAIEVQQLRLHPTESLPASPLQFPNCFVSSPLHEGNVPSKAIKVLGIRTDPAGCKSRPFIASNYGRTKTQSISVDEHARSVHLSVQTMGLKIAKDLLVPSSSPNPSMKRRNTKIMHLRGRSTTNSARTLGSADEVLETAASGLWQACRCITSML